MKYNLLQMVQAVLSSLDSDEVDTINETTESTQVALLVRGVYFDIMARADLPENFSLFRLMETTASTPTMMTVPDDVNSIEWIKYNRETASATDIAMTAITPLALDEFMDRMHRLAESATNVETYTYDPGGGTVTFLVENDKGPEYYTTFNDRTLVFDSYDAAVDTDLYLRASNSLGYGKKVITFTMSDTFEFDLDEPQQNLLLQECKALAWAELKQAMHPKAEVSARRGWIKLQSDQAAIRLQSTLQRLPHYGRK